MFSKFKSAFLATTALAVATPVLAEEVNVYSYRQPELIKPLTDAFTEETGIEVNVAYLKKGMIERMTAEGTRSPADLVLTVDISRLSAVVEAGLTQPVESDVLKANVPSLYHDPDGEWWGLTTRARIVYASKDRVQEGEVTTYEDLADPKWKGRICTRSGTNAYNVALTSAVIHHLGEDGAKAWLEGVKDNLARKPQGNDRAQVKAIWAGECDIAIGNTYYMGKMLNDDEQKEWAESVNVVFPTFEGAGTHVNISGVAMAKHAPHPEAALKMMEFLTSPKAQEVYAKANFEYPIAPGSEADALVQSWGDFTADDVNLMTLAEKRSMALKLTEEVDFDG
ncbi:Fe(3+) ABC transporter substrate-binding protein [Shimia thalassica]|uniref:Iron uptake protein A1 n=1 Tax=Shimia thalassica TaxID=1715693 RepID=A0A0P1I7K0_9RHOB|nr:Fe(3+) ABC transporter substrate-binding protein [Shimia thalassica]MBU2941646.1 Fe(3+) ABC transporter substrate-binding protein [Shimia thalassica]MDO6480682.1 Fe(3+) ABC transporter substrate-binding protein [Shimia thalassica]MDO6503973.1 Fe(3+) ABC transporter substrate-binding protein [Shimia thalassica]MDO6521447.1 Fe(3+) ABC transporter substrate-binding protein [Shimia thalassica]MDO6799328.1 Fe(3+) ABC transporter substrate-binding protein [Shimia thalassica]